MLFNSFQFLFFFTFVYIVYRNLSFNNQNKLLLVASYVFYASWDWRFLSLILISTVIDFIAGQKIFYAKNQRKRKQWLMLSIFSNLSILGFFKYYNFFIDSLTPAMESMGLIGGIPMLNIILPVGISFYTFQTMTYSIDIYRKDIAPTKHFLDFALFVAFFPQLVAGPIERAKRLLPQILNPRTITQKQTEEGLWLILWGLFKKVVIADNIASMVDPVFANTFATGPEVAIASYAFAIQIYCDFSGYTDIARGISKLMGFELMLNFNLPFFAHSPSNFWRRWHISLSSWLRDYLYIPLGGNRHGTIRKYRNLMLTMLLGGLWHGAAWTFVIWGAYQGLLLVLEQMAKPLLLPFKIFKFKVIQIIVTFQLMAVGWLIFRAQSYEQIVNFITALPTGWLDVMEFSASIKLLALYALPLLVVQIWQHHKQNMMVFSVLPLVRQASISAALCYFLFVYAPIKSQQFIYFQF